MGVSIFNTGYDLQDQIDAAESAIAIVSVGDTHVAITSGQYVYVREHGTLAEGLYRATANIAANGTLSGSNVTAVSGGGLNALNSNLTKVSNHATVTGSTVSDIQSALVTMNGTMSNNETRSIVFTVGTASGVFKAAAYYGTITRSTSDRCIVRVQTSAYTADSEIIGTYANSAWVWNELALNSNKTDYISVDATSYGRYNKSGWDYAYSQMPSSYKGAAQLAFSGNYRIVCLVQKYSSTYGSIIGVSNDDENPFYYGVKNGNTSLNNLALNSNLANLIVQEEKTVEIESGLICNVPAKTGYKVLYATTKASQFVTGTTYITSNNTLRLQLAGGTVGDSITLIVFYVKI